VSRSLLTLLLLLNYLVVVCASVARPVSAPPMRAYAYVHRPDCQQQNAWRGGACFDDCNGVQYHVQKGHKPVPLQQLLTMLKGLDLHCLPTTARVAPAPAWCEAIGWQQVCLAQVPAGVRVCPDAPPRRG